MPQLLSLADLRAIAPPTSLERRLANRIVDVDALNAIELKRQLQAERLRAYAVSRAQTIRSVLLRELTMGIDVHALRDGIPQTTIAVREEDVVVP